MILDKKLKELNVTGYTQISPEDFERKLRGIFPVAETKPKYLKLVTWGTIVQWISKTDDTSFKGIVVSKEDGEHEVGYCTERWHLDCFAPCDYTPPIIEFVDSPAVEHPKTKDVFEEAIDNWGSRSADIIIEKAKQLEAKAAKYYKDNLQLKQENAQLKEEIKDFEIKNVHLRKVNNSIICNKDELKAELATLKGVKLVYNYEWLDKIVNQYNAEYSLGDNCDVCVRGHNDCHYPLSPKDSATIIMAALAKHLNPLFVEDGIGRSIFFIAEGKYSVGQHTNCGEPKFNSSQAAQQAINILTSISPKILKNYFAL